MYVIGHLTTDLKGVAGKSPSETANMVMNGLYYLSPNLEAFNIKGQAAMGVPVSPDYLVLASIRVRLRRGPCYGGLSRLSASGFLRRRNYEVFLAGVGNGLGHWVERSLNRR